MAGGIIPGEEVKTMVDFVRIERPKPLNTMSKYKLIDWLRRLCNACCSEQSDKTVLLVVEEELLRTVIEVQKALQPMQKIAFSVSEKGCISQPEE